MTIPNTGRETVWRGEELVESCFINGSWKAGDAEGVDVVDPATERTLARVSFASVAQVALAVDAARRAFDSGPWPATSPADRSTLLHRLCDLFDEHTDEFVDLIIAETGSPVPLARVGQVTYAQECLRWFADAAKRGPSGGYEWGLPLDYGPATTSSLLRREPVGVVASITAYNYPLLLLVRKLGGALAAGCTTVVMPSERAPLATWRFFQLLEGVGYPPGVANLVVSDKSAGVELTTNPNVDMVTFTGSVTVGREVMRQAADTTKRVVLELGGKSPTVVLPGAELDLAVTASIQRFTALAGQGCACGTRTLVSREDYEAYADAASHCIAGLHVGDPRAEGTDVGPLIRAEHRASVEGYVERALEGGGKIFAGGGRPGDQTGFYMNPTYLSGVSNDSEIAQNELFGPVGVLLPYSTVDEAIKIANATRFGLAAHVWGPTAEAMNVAQRLRAGTVSINGGGRLRPDVHWGGYGDSGNGRESGEEGFREFFEIKHIQWPI